MEEAQELLEEVRSLRASALAGQPCASLVPPQPLDPSQLEEVIGLLIPFKTFPIPPSAGLRPEPLALKPLEHAVPEQSNYTWRWLPLGLKWQDERQVEHHGSFPLPVAVTVKAHDGYVHLLSLTSLWHLLELSTPWYSQLCPSGPVWPFFRELRLPPSHIFPSVKSHLKRPSSQESLAEPSGQDAESKPEYGFKMWMGTPLASLGYVAFNLRASNCKRARQGRILEVLRELAQHAAADPFTLRLPADVVLNFVRPRPSERVSAPWAFVQEALHGFLQNPERPQDSVSFGDLWEQALQNVDLTPPGQPVRLADFVWFVCRHSSRFVRMGRVCYFVAHQLAQAIETAFQTQPDRLRSDLEGLPVDSGLPLPDLQKALRGPDKDFLSLHSFLKKSTGYGKGPPVVLGDLTHCDQQSHSRFLVSSFVAAYFWKAKARVSQVASTNQKAVFATCLAFDASRCFKMEVTSSVVALGDLVFAGPPQILTDLDAALSGPGKFLQAIEDVTLKSKVTVKNAKYDASKNCLLAMAQVLDTLLPFASSSIFGPWVVQPPVLCPHGAKRAVADGHLDGPGASGHYYVADASKDPPRTAFCLPPSLRHEWRPGCVQLLCLAGDECAVGWRCFQFLAGPASCRVMWHGDPAHRMTNLYLNAMKAVPCAFKVIQAVLLLHKYRRAPFGGGKFWKQAVLTITVLTHGGQRLHPLLEAFAHDIAEDLEVPPALLGPSQCLQAMTAKIGPKVEMRRWWSHYDASLDLLKVWHLLLVALVAQERAAGRDPLQGDLPGQLPKVAAPDKPGTTFHFRDMVLTTLKNPLYNQVLRSSIVVFRPLRTHFASFQRAAQSSALCLEHTQIWSSADRWHEEVVGPTLAHSLLDPDCLAEAGFLAEVAPFAVPVLDDHTGLQTQEEACLVHLRQCVSCVFHLLGFSALYQTPPWLFSQLLVPGPLAPGFLDGLKEMWGLCLRLEGSKVRKERALVTSGLSFFQWHTVREPFLLLEAGQWEWPCPKAAAYAHGLFSGVPNTLACENSFNDVRDSERRRAKHQKLSPEGVAGIAIQSLQKRFDPARVVNLDAAHVESCSSVHVERATFAPKGSLTSDAAGVPVERITASDWSTTSAHAFAYVHCWHLQALLLAAPAVWDLLWAAKCFRPHTIASVMDTKEHFYVVGSTPHLLVSLPLQPLPDGTWTFVLEGPSPRPKLMVATRVPEGLPPQYLCHHYHLSYRPGDGEQPFRFHLGRPQPLLHYLLLNYAHKVPAQVLKDLVMHLKLHAPRGATIPALVETLFLHAGLEGEQRDRMMTLVQETYKKRFPTQSQDGKPSSSDAAPACDDDDAWEGDPDLHADGGIGQVLADLAPQEYDFLRGRLPGGKATTEEEEDAELAENNRAEDPDPAEAKAVEEYATTSATSAASASASSQAAPLQRRTSIRHRSPDVPGDCALWEVLGDDHAPQWRGYLPTNAQPHKGHLSCARSWRSGDHKGCGRTKEAARQEVVQWLVEAMSSQASIASPSAKPASSSAASSAKRPRRQ